jgi:hypothetical protein
LLRVLGLSAKMTLFPTSGSVYAACAHSSELGVEIVVRRPVDSCNYKVVLYVSHSLALVCLFVHSFSYYIASANTSRRCDFVLCLYLAASR